MELQELSKRANQVLGCFAKARSSQGLSPEEIAVFLTVGCLGIVFSHDLVALKPITYQEIAHFLLVPKATVRRRAIRLQDKKLIVPTGRGVVLGDISAWCSLIREMFQSGEGRA